MLLDFSYLKCLHCQFMALQGERGESQPLIPVSTSGNRGGQAEHWLGHKCGFRVFAGLGLLCNSHFSTQPVTVGVPWRSFQKPVVTLTFLAKFFPEASWFHCDKVLTPSYVLQGPS